MIWAQLCERVIIHFNVLISTFSSIYLKILIENFQVVIVSGKLVYKKHVYHLYQGHTFLKVAKDIHY